MRKPVPQGLTPTRRTMRQAEYEIRPIAVNGPKLAVRVSPCLVALLLRRALITNQQCEAGLRYESDHRLVWGSGGTRDSCVLPVGGVAHESDAQVQRIMQAKYRMNQILNTCGPGPYALLAQVTVYEEPLGRSRYKAEREVYNQLRAGLDAAAKVYGIPEYEAKKKD